MYSFFLLFVVTALLFVDSSTKGENITTNVKGQQHPPIVRVYHFAINYWAESYSGEMPCGQEIRCIWSHSDHIKTLRHRMQEDLEADRLASLSLSESMLSSQNRRVLNVREGIHRGEGGKHSHHARHHIRTDNGKNESETLSHGNTSSHTILVNGTNSQHHHDSHSSNHQIMRHHTTTTTPSYPTSTVTLSVYNVHSWWERTREYHPATCELRTNLTLVETEESRARFSKMFDPIFKNFDGFSSTHPTAHVQRVYIDAFLNESSFINTTLIPFSSLIKGGSYVASDCHKRDSANSNRDSVVGELRKYGLRVDGLGQCMHTPTGPEGVALPTGKEFRYSLSLKRIAISKFMFNMAFENSIEPGYVTEKPFDALVSGTVPVYLGDATHLKSLLPHPKAAIFVADFPSIEALTKYLLFLTTNETAYEEHREWRKTYSQSRHLQNSSPLLKSPWYCRVCQWALETSKLPHKPRRLCHGDGDKRAENVLQEYEGKVVRGQRGKELFFVQNGTLRSIPNMDTFMSLKIDVSSVITVPDGDIKQMKVGIPLQKSSG